MFDLEKTGKKTFLSFEDSLRSDCMFEISWYSRIRHRPSASSSYFGAAGLFLSRRLDKSRSQGYLNNLEALCRSWGLAWLCKVWVSHLSIIWKSRVLFEIVLLSLGHYFYIGLINDRTFWLVYFTAYQHPYGLFDAGIWLICKCLVIIFLFKGIWNPYGLYKAKIWFICKCLIIVFFYLKAYELLMSNLRPKFDYLYV